MTGIKNLLCWANDIETCLISYVKLIASPGSMHDTGCSGLVHRDDPEGWYGEDGRRGFRIHVDVWKTKSFNLR